jgi:TPR repeat protein
MRGGAKDDATMTQDEAQSCWENAVSFLEAEKDAEALPLLHLLWNEGYTGAAFEIANILERECALKATSFEEAQLWFERAVDESNSVEAQFNLARIIIRISHSERMDDPKKTSLRGINILKKLSSENVVEASIFLGIQYFNGKTVDTDYEMAESLFMKSVSHGYIIGYLLLREVYMKKKMYISALVISFQAVIRYIILLINNRKDRRLILMDSHKYC